MMRNHRHHVNIHDRTTHHRTKTHSVYDLMTAGEYVSHGGHRISGHRAPEPPMASNAVKAAEANEQHPGIIPYPGRTIRLVHPKGVQIEAVSTADDRWSANPVTRYNPVANNSAGD